MGLRKKWSCAHTPTETLDISREGMHDVPCLYMRHDLTERASVIVITDPVQILEIIDHLYEIYQSVLAEKEKS